jgi:hypothetical protein
MVHEHYLVLDTARARRFERYTELKHNRSLQTLAVFVEPLCSTSDNAEEPPDVTSQIPSRR